jgi:alpha-mannosidase
MEGFITLEQLTLEQAIKHEFNIMNPGTAWGAKWEYGWFRGTLMLPDEATGKRIVLVTEVGGEGIIYVNGAAAGARDRMHKEIMLAKQGVSGTKYDLLIESYAGHGPRNAHAGPTPPWRETVPEPPPAQVVVGETTFGIWQEDVYQLWVDVETLWQLRENLDENSLRVMEIDAGLRDFTLLTDFELSRTEMLETVKTARERLKPLLECYNGSTAPVMYGFGHSHIDVAWLWPLQETERKEGRTLATQLALMEQYPEFIFLQSQPHLYWMLQQRYPEIYQRVKEAASNGQLIAEGGTWVEPDTNISSGESLIRQFIHGKRFYKEEFGVDCELLWLPDVFGYSGALPQIMRGCGVKYFSTQKIFWAYHGGDPFPYNTFIWEGIDGSEIYVHLHRDYNARVNPENVIKRWNTRVQKDGFSRRLYPFGFGDGGGGPTRNHLEFARRLADLEGAPKFVMASPMQYFKDQEAVGWPENRYVGELYFQCHRGVYTSQAKTKKGNRKSELALRRAEMWAVAAQSLGDYLIPAEALDEAWKKVLLNQFHDILPGSSIARVYEEAEAAYAVVLASAESVTKQAVQTLVKDTDSAVTVFNDLSWSRRVLVPLPTGFEGAVDTNGRPLPVQKDGEQVLAEVVVPSCGWTTLRQAESIETSSAVMVKEKILENEYLKVTFNDYGEITSLIDKQAPQSELAAGLCNCFAVYKDVPTLFDAWDIDSMYELLPVSLDQEATFKILAEGPLVGTLRITRQLNNSTMTQEVSLRRGSRRVEFKTAVNWQEKHKLLKVKFPVNIHSNEAVHEIQFGYIKRPNHRSRPFDSDRFEVANQKWTALTQGNQGFAVLNDCKYGVNVLGNSINLTLLKSAMAPDMHADLGLQEFTYAFYAWTGNFADSDLIREGYELNCPVMAVRGDGGTNTPFFVDTSNVILETVKPAEDGSGDIIVRLYEAKQMATKTTLHTSLPVKTAVLTNMLEEPIAEPTVIENGKITLIFSPFEVKTLRLMQS